MSKINKIIFIIFLFFALILGSHHEPWTDEAQSWIIARDASTFEIIWDISRYEGTFPLWFLTLKFFISIGLKYEYLFIVPIIISLLGLIVFLKKVEAPTYVKVLLPFSYYVFYQYTVVARSYCYFLLAFSLWAITYKNRIDKKLNYILSLIFISFISMHGMVISFVLGNFFFIELFKQKRLKKSIKHILLLGIIWLLEVIILCPRSDLYMNVASLHSIEDICRAIINSIITDDNILIKFYNLIGLVLFAIITIHLFFIKNKDLSITFCALFLFVFIIRLVSHHLGIFYLLVIFGVICNYEEIKNKSKHFEKIFKILLVFFTIYTVLSGVNEYYKEYSGAKKMAEYIKQNGYTERVIYGFGYKTVSIQAYFEENIYDNREETIYRWSKNNKDFYNYVNFFDLDMSQFTDVPEFILIEDSSDLQISKLEEIIENTGKYEIEYKTMGNLFFKNAIIDTEGYTLYRLKNSID